MTIINEELDKLITAAMDELPQQYIRGLKNVLITFEDEPTDEQRNKQKLRPWQTLLGLYEGIPLTQRNNSYNLVLPDKITLFKGPIERMGETELDIKEHIKRTLWHEIAHYYGLGHGRIHELENK